MRLDRASPYLASGGTSRNVDGCGVPDAARAGHSARNIGPRLTVHLPLFLVVVALLFLALLPIFIQGRIAAALDKLSDVTDPASTAVSDIQVAFAREAADTRAFLLTGDERYAVSHHRAQAARRRAYAWLVDRAADMKPEVRGALVEMGRDLRPADELVDALYSGTLTHDQYMALLPVQHERLQAVTGATARLQMEIRRDAATRREHIRAIHRLDALLSLAGVLLAFAAIMSVARLSAKNRSLAERERNAHAASERAYAEAERRRHEVARISASRQALVRGFSHDVKNPLGAADGYLFMLEQGLMGILTSRQRNAVERSRHSVKTAIQLIQDLLDLARSETGDIDLHLMSTDLCEIAVRTVDNYRAHAGSKGLVVTTDLPAASPALQSDPARVGQILGNLLSNAIKYTEAGGVTVRVGRRQDDAGCEWSVVDVSDTGPGIAKESQRLVFDEFERLGASPRTSGAGIGLAISQRLAGLLGGRITIDSDLGCGSTFTLWLPFDATASTNHPATVERAWIGAAQAQ